jgi:hypothetical protein
MGGQGIEIQLQLISGENGWCARGQTLPHFVDKHYGIIVLALLNMNDGDDFGLRIKRYPHIQPFLQSTQFGHQFIQLQMTTQPVEKVGMCLSGVLPTAFQPALNGALVMFENTVCS